MLLHNLDLNNLMIPTMPILIEKGEYTRETLLFVELISLRKLDEFPRSLARSMVLLSFSLFRYNEKQQEEDRLLPSNEPLALVQPSPFPLWKSVYARFSSVWTSGRSVPSIPFREQYRESKEKKKKNFRIVHLHRGNFSNSRWRPNERRRTLSFFSKSSLGSKWFWV